ncbi:MAG: HDIG domain-containing protein [Nitrososphaerota archaeon]|uniref:HDIG domain-containing metalloprotein n=1 Tax=Candidatus Bathycorpusculum sp. TaxID=2994959 RepID=UPI002822EFE0|nr:HDIG domain-containing protein [Candidatus Termiticorpusculum sp.]MCL2257595.1 HDIG domain-containing protein [Candidatus Termiticorpusculum sp.]MCL2292256.1 HDIG domain-containing protein [Candidatus Termiticorpusculum sp.]MDR0460451.1 HDIG domain-containing protein [Nitrososphaerota archaeon]
MSKQLPTREQAISILQKNKCSPEVIAHCQAVALLALELAEKIEAKKYFIDVSLIEAGALLHDLGRAKTHSVNHAIEGMQLAQAEGLPDAIVCIIKRHIGAGITTEEAQLFNWPKDNYIPQTLEEKIVCYADKCISGTKRIPVETTIKQLQDQKLEDAAKRVRKLYNEITQLLEDHNID